ncbi:transcriptional regulator [Tistrella bauzanensis]|uniref:Transcriptional regulator n=1 Tax=Tistrella bauzanensis TaxID=657419 RepID=A0ABQ1IB17_9PROT|nr:sigma 54-interacting transcriptional regulator [Tistrella bauzanensis]GGB31297.1 transcriptional regulator [Tistrella bauzanensis]
MPDTSATRVNRPPVPLAAGLHRLLFQAAAQPMLVFDPIADRILLANPAAGRLYGMPADTLAALRMSELHAGQMPALVVFTEAVLDKGHAWTRGMAITRPDGSDVVAEYDGTRLPPDAGGTLILLVATDQDDRHRRDVDAEADAYLKSGIAEWRRVERFFRDVERQNQLILRAAGEGIYGINADGHTTFVNPAAERLLGWRAEELVGHDMHGMVHHTHADGSHYPEHECPIYAAFREGEIRHVEDEVFWCRDGRPIRVEYTSTPIRDRGMVVGAVIVFRDVTSRREAEERLHAALAEVDALRERLERENAYLLEEIRTEVNHHHIIGRNAAIQKIAQQIDLVAPTDANVLITGESGTGKELIARAIHEAGRRSHRPLIRVNCAAIPRELFESEFFGHVRGAFTGAVRDRVGRFELADGGTLFLDEVGEIPLELQGKLLRVLQEGHFERVGEERTRAVDVRIVAATNRDLKDEVRRGRFREDLYFRLNVFPIESVPLRERLDDVPLLAAHFLAQTCRRLNIPALKLTRGDVERLTGYDWPGNVRELENVIERAAILASGGRLRFDLEMRDPPPAIPGPASPVAIAPMAGAAETATAESAAIITETERRNRDRQAIEAALSRCGGRIYGPAGAAALLDLPPTTLASRLRALRIDARRFKTPAGG